MAIKEALRMPILEINGTEVPFSSISKDLDPQSCEIEFDGYNRHAKPGCLRPVRLEIEVTGLPPRTFNAFTSNRLRIIDIQKAVWVFPKEPFITYEPSDESWCRYCGFGHEEAPAVTVEAAFVTSMGFRSVCFESTGLIESLPVKTFR